MTDLPPKALSIRQPWAWAIINAGKDIENRSWQGKFRGSVCVHAAKGMTADEFNGFVRTIHGVSLVRPFPSGASVPSASDLPRGGIIDCVSRSESPWFFGDFGFVLANPRPVDFIPCRGKLGFFDWRSPEWEEPEGTMV